MLKIYNTKTRKKETFKEIKKGEVRMYTCGPTVYDFAHIGNFRAYMVADVLRRYLEYKDYKVTQVMNITDVDDKTIRNSIDQGLSLKEYTEKYTKAFFEDLKTLNIEPAAEYPRATEHIPEVVDIIKKLMEKGIAYKGDDNSVYYNVKKFKEYGKLSGIKVDELQSGARVKHDEYEKEQAHDFALWKAWDSNDGEVFWETELGKGRPGWHIECSAMSSKYLGEHFDIHTGGVDLIFPHHENEIAQSEGASGKKFVNCWFHNEYLKVNGKKMSKSLGNFFTLRDLLSKGNSAKGIRYLLLSAHYKAQFNFTEDGLKAAESAIERLSEFISKINSISDGENNPEVVKTIKKAKKDFETFMDDDLNISSGLAAVFDFVKDVNKIESMSKKDAEAVLDTIKDFDKVLGVMDFSEESVPKEILELVEKREEARKAKNWAESDKLRDEIKEKGFVINDTPTGARVKRC